MNRDEVLVAQKEFLFPAVFHYYRDPLVIARGKNQYLWDASGRQYLDFFGGIVVVSVGHCNETVNAKVKTQLDTLAHVSTLFPTEPQVRLAEKIASLTPGRALTKSFFTNSGTEANEMAVLTARCYTGSSDIVALRYSYHGRSAMALAMTGQSLWQVGPRMSAGFTHAHNAYCYRCPYGMTYPECEVRCADDVEETIRTTTSGRIAGFIAEPIQGTAGFVTPPKEYFRKVAEIVRRYGGVFISDEVQTAWGRTGRWWGIENWDVVPDIIVSAKGLGNGLPIGVTVAKAEIAEAMKGLTISTFGGNPVTTTAGRAVIDYIEENNLPANCEATGAYMRLRLEEMRERHPLIGDVRGMGLMQALELVKDRKTKTPAGEETVRVMEAARDQGLLIGKGGMFGNCLRLTPPMNIARADVDEMVRMLDHALQAVEKETMIQRGTSE
jgi:4-aminobutyrate aminotransferase-like enzyme